jgi:hypothetical protein
MTSSSNYTDREAVRSAVGSVLVNASNYPAKVSFRMLGLDLGPLIDKTTDAILTKFLPGHDERVKAEAWDEGWVASESYDGYFAVPTNPYRRES